MSIKFYICLHWPPPPQPFPPQTFNIIFTVTFLRYIVLTILLQCKESLSFRPRHTCVSAFPGSVTLFPLLFAPALLWKQKPPFSFSSYQFSIVLMVYLKAFYFLETFSDLRSWLSLKFLYSWFFLLLVLVILQVWHCLVCSGVILICIHNFYI